MSSVTVSLGFKVTVTVGCGVLFEDSVFVVVIVVVVVVVVLGILVGFFLLSPSSGLAAATGLTETALSVLGLSSA